MTVFAKLSFNITVKLVKIFQEIIVKKIVLCIAPEEMLSKEKSLLKQAMKRNLEINDQTIYAKICSW